MKKLYVTPCMKENSFEFCDGIAIDYDPTHSTSDQLVKSRDNTEDESLFDNGSEWKNGLW